MNKEIRKFVENLSNETKLENARNLYNYEEKEGLIRRDNLENYLLKFNQSKPKIILIGEYPLEIIPYFDSAANAYIWAIKRNKKNLDALALKMNWKLKDPVDIGPSEIAIDITLGHWINTLSNRPFVGGFGLAL